MGRVPPGILIQIATQHQPPGRQCQQSVSQHESEQIDHPDGPIRLRLTAR